MWSLPGYPCVALLFVIVAMPRPSLAVSCPWTCKCERGEQTFAISCAYSGLTELPRFPDQTTSIEITQLNLDNIPITAFSNLRKLQRLTFANPTKPIVLVQDLFASQGNLSSLSLKSHVLIDISNTNFIHLQSLETFLIKAMQRTIPEPQICNLTQLVDLNLASNNITGVNFGKCFTTLSRLARINLDDNPNLKLKADSFKHLAPLEIKLVSLRECSLKALENETFAYLPKLTEIRLGKNQITYLPDDIFRNMSYLRVLNLDDNRLHAVPCQPFYDIPHIHTLDLSGNKNMVVSFCEAFGRLVNLTSLNLRKTNLTTLPDDLFSNLTGSLKCLYLNNNRLENITGKALLQLPSLSNLTLDRNPLTFTAIQSIFENTNSGTIEEITLEQTRKFETLNSSLTFPLSGSSITSLKLRECKIGNVSSRSFKGMHSLKILDLSKNNIVVIEPDAFTGAINLEELRLNGNNIAQLHIVSKLGMPSSLRSLHLDSNKLSEIVGGQFRCLFNLENLYLSDNVFKSLGIKSFENLTQLTTLTLSHNKIKFVRNEHFSHTKKLRSLDISFNLIRDVGKDLLKATPDLLKLDIRGNNIGRAIRKLDIQKTVNLTILKLMKCGVSKIPQDFFQGCRSLRYLNLGQNALESLDVDVFKGMESLQTLDLASNKLAYINKDTFVALKSLNKLDLSENPFACNCDLVWFRQWIIEEDVFLTKIGNKQIYVCSSPETQKGNALLDMTLTISDCEAKNFALVIGLSVSLVVLLWTLVVGLVYRYRWHLRYLWHLLRVRRQRYLAQIDETDYDFDAFVAYAEEDRRFVIDTLLPELEYRHGFKLCLHHRNWLPGNTIIDNIVESVERSRKVILVISNTFTKRFWCQMELQMAHNKPLDGKTHTMIVILLEDLKPENMTPTLRHLLTTKTYIMWTSNTGEHKALWRNLRAALRRPVGLDGPTAIEDMAQAQEQEDDDDQAPNRGEDIALM